MYHKAFLSMKVNNASYLKECLNFSVSVNQSSSCVVSHQKSFKHSPQILSCYSIMLQIETRLLA